MISSVAVQFIRAPCGDIPLRVDRPFDSEGSRVGRRGGFHPLGQLNLELIPHPRTGRRILQKKVHYEELADFDKFVLLLVGFGYGPCARICGEIPGEKCCALPC